MKRISLRTELENQLNKRIIALQEGLEQAKKTAALTRTLNTSRATYTVSLRSLWEDHGGKSTKTNYKGNLSDAMATAEKEFKAANSGRSGIQADYSVTIRIGEMEVSVPTEYWEKYKEKNSD